MRTAVLAAAALLSVVPATAVAQPPGHDAVCYMRTEAELKARIDACSRLIRSLGRTPAAARPYGARALHYAEGNAMAEARKDADRAVKLDDREPFGHLARADLAKRQGRFDLALIEVEKAAALRPEYYTFLLRGRVLATLAQNDRAMADFTRAIEMQPTWSPPLVARGNIHWDKGDYANALADYEAARRLDPTSPVIIENQVLALQELGRSDEAVAIMDDAIARAPRDPFLLVVRGKFNFAAHRSEAAVPDLKSAVAIEPRLGRAWSILGDAYGELGRYDDALAAYGRALALRPNDASALNGRCWLRAASGRDLPAAYADCNRAVELDADAINLDSRGFARFKAGDIKAALSDFEAALVKAPAHSASLFMRGVIRVRDGRTTEGRADIARAEKLSPGITERYARYGVTL